MDHEILFEPRTRFSNISQFDRFERAENDANQSTMEGETADLHIEQTDTYLEPNVCILQEVPPVTVKNQHHVQLPKTKKSRRGKHHLI